MNKRKPSRMHSLVVRELREYRNSLVITPLAIAATLTLIMLASVILANRISVMGEVMMDSLAGSDSSREIKFSIQLDDNGDSSARYSVSEQQEPLAEEEWNFSRGWTFKPGAGTTRQGQVDDDAKESGTLNIMFNLMHSFMLVVLVAVTINYLLGSLFNDRKDRSILFWKSMPVSDWEQVAAKLLVALVAAPGIYIAASLITQLITALLSMLLMWRMDVNPIEALAGNIDIMPLLVTPIVGWVITAIWIAPLYAWLMLASAGARRSPFMLAVAPVVALVVLEQIFIGSHFVGSAVGQHLPHYKGSEDAVGFYISGNEWANVDALKMGLGLLFAAVAIRATVWLRRYRFEL